MFEADVRVQHLQLQPHVHAEPEPGQRDGSEPYLDGDIALTGPPALPLQLRATDVHLQVLKPLSTAIAHSKWQGSSDTGALALDMLWRIDY
jgi:hypothetical protein